MSFAVEPEPAGRTDTASTGYTNDTEQFLRKGIAYSVLALAAMLVLTLFGLAPLLFLAPGIVASLGVIISFGIHLNSFTDRR